MEREKAIAELRRIQEKYNPKDPEVGHDRGDTVLCDLLKSLGYGDVVAEWDKLIKWYA